MYNSSDNQDSPQLEALQKAIEICGNSQSELARRIGKTQSLVGAWVNRFKQVGVEYVLDVSAAVEWVITPHQLRPDIYPNIDDGLPIELRPKREAA